MLVRSARPEDRAGIEAVQRASPEASQWDPAGYDVTVAEIEGTVAGFLVTRRIVEEELEILNLAVDPQHRRAGVARALIEPLMKAIRGDIFLEVRESNVTAQRFYQAIGFEEVSRRPAYYQAPPEGGIVMKFHSC